MFFTNGNISICVLYNIFKQHVWNKEVKKILEGWLHFLFPSLDQTYSSGDFKMVIFHGFSYSCFTVSHHITNILAEFACSNSVYFCTWRTSKLLRFATSSTFKICCLQGTASTKMFSSMISSSFSRSISTSSLILSKSID